MRKIIVVAAREYQAAVRTKAFIIMLVAMPVLMSGSIVSMKLLEGQVDTADKRIAVLDRSGVLFDPLREAAALSAQGLARTLRRASNWPSSVGRCAPVTCLHWW